MRLTDFAPLNPVHSECGMYQSEMPLWMKQDPKRERLAPCEHVSLHIASNGGSFSGLLERRRIVGHPTPKRYMSTGEQILVTA
jgi:hypothetical protein